MMGSFRKRLGGGPPVAVSKTYIEGLTVSVQLLPGGVPTTGWAGDIPVLAVRVRRGCRRWRAGSVQGGVVGGGQVEGDDADDLGPVVGGDDGVVD